MNLEANKTPRVKFPRQYLDAKMGLHYNYFRDYDPTTGRYLQSDPIGLAGGLNAYLYASANPLRFIDPTGEIEFEPPIDPKDPVLDPRNPPRPKPPGGIPEVRPPQPPVETPEPPGKGKAAQVFCRTAVLAPCLRGCASPLCPPHPVAKGGCAAACYAAYLGCLGLMAF